jgi:hypothetical protein
MLIGTNDDVYHHTVMFLQGMTGSRRITLKTGVYTEKPDPLSQFLQLQNHSTLHSI